MIKEKVIFNEKEKEKKIQILKKNNKETNN